MNWKTLFVAAFVCLALACSQEQTAETQTRNQSSAASSEVVIYTAHDRQFSEPILQQFTEQTGIEVKAVYDTEAVKTVGLVNRLIAEKQRPQCDVFWNNEIVRTIQLKREGVTQPYVSPAASDVPDELKDPDDHWTGFGTRARVIAVNTELLPNREDWPDSVMDLVDPEWEGNAAFAKPLFGTTSSHAAIMWAQWGEERAMEFWNQAMDNAVMHAGNAQARDAAAAGEVAWCLTDTDDANGAIEDGYPVEIIYPDAAEDQMGVVLIPNTVSLIANGPNQENGQKLIDFLLSHEVEAQLAQSRAAQIPVRPGIEPPDALESLEGVKIMPIDWEAVADALVPCQTELIELIGS